MRQIKGFYSKKTINDNVEGSYISGLADPFIYRFNGDYYLFFTAPKGLKAFKSHDLIHFEEVDNGVNPKGFIAIDEKLVHAYAPECIYFNGYFYIITSMGGNGHHILKSSSIVGPYEFITDNIHESIDGSFFIDEDEEIYVSRASESGIAMNKLEPDFTKFKVNQYGIIDSVTYDEARTFGWTEGPHVLKRYGKYYLTYTGTHFLSSAYRVNYAVGDSLNNRKSFKFMDTIIMSLADDFYGLGHSSTFLGPNLDSYFITYHDMNPNGVRTFNISRLLFSNNMMTVNDVNNNLHFNIEMPDFESRNKSEFLSKNNAYFYKNSFKNKYTFEINYTGENEKIYFGYIDDKNKFYAGSAANLLEIHSVIDGNDTVIYSKKFKFNYLKNAIKTLRIQIFENKLNLYFNNIEILYNFDLPREADGDIGFSENLELTFFAVSKYSFGNSDNAEIKLARVFATNFDESNTSLLQIQKNDFVDVSNKPLRYFVYKKEAGKYYLDMYIKSNQKHLNIDLKINGISQNVEVELLNKEEYRNITVVDLKEGINEIEISSSDNFSFSYFEFEKILRFCGDFVENLTEKNSYLTHIGRPEFNAGGLYFDNDRNFSYIEDIYEDFDVETNIFVRGNPNKDETFAGLVVLNKNYGKNNAFEGAYSLDGIIFAINSCNIFVIEAGFDKTKILKKAELNGSSNKILRIIKKGQKMYFYENDNLFFNYDLTHSNLRGRIGLYNVHTSVYFRNLIIKKGGLL